MLDLKNLLPEIEAFEIYENIEFLDELTDDELRLVLQSVYYYSDELFARDICERWTRDKSTHEHIPSPAFHKEMWTQEATREDALYIVARDHGKTTGVSKIRTLKELLYGLEKSILFIMTKSLGEAVVGDIRKELEINEKIRFIYGNLVPSENRKDFKTEKWRQRELQLLNGTELKTITKGEAVRGLRPTKIRVDDPQEKKDVKNPIMAKEFSDWFWTAVYPTLDDGGSVSVLATIISNNCFANQLKLEAKERHFKVIEYPAILDFNEDDFSGRPLWPEKWSLEALKRRYEKMGKREFMQEYQNIPFVTNGQPVFDPEYTFTIMQPLKEDNGLIYYRELTTTGNAGETKKLYRGILGIDLASGVVGGDYSTITARTQDGKLLCQYRGHITQDRLCDVVDEIVSQLIDCVVIPENNMALAFLAAAKNYSWHRKIYRQKTMDKITMKQSEVLGFNTNAKTKPLIINRLDQLMRSGNYEVSELELEEIQHYYHDERGGMNAITPYHDDLIISDALVAEAAHRGFSAPALMFF